MADEIDRAQEYQTTDIAHAVARVKRYAGVSATHCEACGDQIPNARRAALPGCQNCVTCQEELDRGGFWG